MLRRRNAAELQCDVINELSDDVCIQFDTTLFVDHAVPHDTGHPSNWRPLGRLVLAGLPPDRDEGFLENVFRENPLEHRMERYLKRLEHLAATDPAG